MRSGNLKMLIHVAIAIACLSGGIYYSVLKNTNKNFLETSVLTVLKAINQDLEMDALPDLAIEDLSLEKIHNPTSTFNYYRYKATLVVKNYGGTLVNGQVVLHGDENQKYSFVRNTSKGFYLQKNGTYVISDYDVLFDGNYNGGKVALTIDVKDKTDVNPANNSASVDVFELPPKIKDISLKNISDKKSFAVGFSEDPDLQSYDFDVFTTRQYSFPPDALKYAEVSGSGHVYGYYKAQNNGDIVTSAKWQKIVNLDKDYLSVKFVENPFEDVDEHYLYLKATDPENGNYVVSNVIKFPRHTALTRDDFAKDFEEYFGIPPADYAVLHGEYSPQKKLSRGEVLRIFMDSLNVELPRDAAVNHFEDVPAQYPLFPYAEALYEKGSWKVFGSPLNPDLPATKDYFLYLANVFSSER